MAPRRFYFPGSSSHAAPVSPAFDARWDTTGSAIRRALLTAPATDSASTISNSETSAATVQLLCFQHVSDSIPTDRTFGGTVQGVISGRETSTGADAFLYVHAYVVSSDGATVRGTLFTLTNETELTTAAIDESRTFSGSVAAVSALAGDRIVIESGTEHRNTDTISLTSRLTTSASSAGGFADHTYTDGESNTSKRSWVEFSQDPLAPFDQVAAILDLNVGSKISVINLPSQSDASTKSFFMEGYAERIGPETHHFEFNVSPTTGFDVWVLDDATYSVLDTTTKLAY